jgi:hypothetical protein
MATDLTIVPSITDPMWAECEQEAERWLASKRNFAERTIALAQRFFTLRVMYQSNQEFGAQCRLHPFISKINPHDRSALIWMGRYLTVTRDVLATTDRTSLKYLWLNEIKPRVYPAITDGDAEYVPEPSLPKSLDGVPITSADYPAATAAPPAVTPSVPVNRNWGRPASTTPTRSKSRLPQLRQNRQKSTQSADWKLMLKVVRQYMNYWEDGGVELLRLVREFIPDADILYPVEEWDELLIRVVDFRERLVTANSDFAEVGIFGDTADDELTSRTRKELAGDCRLLAAEALALAQHCDNGDTSGQAAEPAEPFIL